MFWFIGNINKIVSNADYCDRRTVAWSVLLSVCHTRAAALDGMTCNLVVTLVGRAVFYLLIPLLKLQLHLSK